MWTQTARFSSGPVFRPVNKGDRLSGDSMTAQSVFEAVKLYATRSEIPDFTPQAEVVG